MTVSHYADCPHYRTKDGSEIRELMHPDVHGNHGQSLAEARVPAGGRTLAHRHARSEELYHVTAGAAWLYRDGQKVWLQAGDTARIAPGCVHWLDNPGPAELAVLCCCAPAYAHADTELIDEASDV